MDFMPKRDRIPYRQNFSVDMDTIQERKVKTVLVIGRSQDDAVGEVLTDWFKGKDYRFQFLVGGYPNCATNVKLYLKSDARDVEFNMAEFVDRTVEKVRTERISGVIGFHDLDMLIAAIVSERCGLPGPTAESTFLCYHKYYSRKVENPKLWFEGIDINNEEWRSKMRYPCWIKPVCQSATIGGRRIRNEAEMKAAIEDFRVKFAALNRFYQSVFEIAVDKAKYPLACSIMLLAEELVEGDDVTQHCVEGWADRDGNFHLCEIDDDIISDTTVFSSEMIPSTMTDEERRLVVAESIDLIRKTGLKSCVFIIEVFLRNDDGKPRVDTIEINHRACWNHHYYYMALWGTSQMVIAVSVACGEDDEARAECAKMTTAPGEIQYSMNCLFQARRSGLISDIVDLDAVEYYKQTPQEEVYGAFLKPGVVLEYPLTTNINLMPEGNRVGFFVIRGKDPVKLKERADEVRSRLVRDVRCCINDGKANGVNKFGVPGGST